jgi:hypothetical protein
MTGAAAAAVIMRRERDLVAHLRIAGAVSPSTAQTPAALGVHERLAWSRLVARAVIRSTGNGAYYLDEPSWEALRRMRHRVALLMGVIVVLLLLTVLARTR